MKSRPITKSSKRAVAINKVFGSKKEAIDKIRKTLDLTDDSDFLTNEIILSPLHLDVAIVLAQDVMSFLDGKDLEKAETAKKVFFYRLCGSICHALSSRVKNDKYEAHRNIDWLKMSEDFQFVAAQCEINLKLARLK